MRHAHIVKKFCLFMLFAFSACISVTTVFADSAIASTAIAEYDKYFEAGNLEAAHQVLIEALAKEPKNAFLKNYLGIFLAGQGEFEEAVPYLLGTFALNQNNTTKALAAAALELDDKEVMRALIPRLMNYRKGDTTMITILVFFGLKLEIAEPIYYRSVIEGCSKEYLLSNPDVRDLIHDYPQFFFDEDEIEPFFKKYNITDREEEE